MILSKAALQLVELTTPDKDVPVLDCVCIEPSGIVVACNRMMTAAVLPIGVEVQKNVPLEDSGRLHTQMVLTSASVRSILKIIPKDRLFHGMLEFCDIDENGNVTVTDGRQKHLIKVSPVKVKFIQYRDEFRAALCAYDNWINTGVEHPVGGTKAIINRKRFKAFVDTLEKVCPYDGNFSPIWIDFSSSDYVVARAKNEITGQQVTAIIPRSAGEWIMIDKSERLLFAQAQKIT
jgi:hypothetical protein